MIRRGKRWALLPTLLECVLQQESDMDRPGEKLTTGTEGGDEIDALLAKYDRQERLYLLGTVVAVNAPFFLLMGMAWSGALPWSVIPLLAVLIAAVGFGLLSRSEWRFATRLLAMGRPGDERVFMHLSRFLRTPQSRGRARRALRSMALTWPAETWRRKGEASAKVLVSLLRPIVRSQEPSPEDVAFARAVVEALAQIATPSAHQALADVAHSWFRSEQMEAVRRLAAELLPEVERRIETRRQAAQLLHPAQPTEALLRAYQGAGQEPAEVLLRAGDE